MTSGELPFGPEGNVLKLFYVHDGVAIKAWQAQDGMVAIVSGRESRAITIRAREFDIPWVAQGVQDKLSAYEHLCGEASVADSEVCVVGDDLPDLGPMRRCGYPVAVANARPDVKRAARFITQRRGGEGAVAEIIYRLLWHNAKCLAR